MGKKQNERGSVLGDWEGLNSDKGHRGQKETIKLIVFHVLTIMGFFSCGGECVNRFILDNKNVK